MSERKPGQVSYLIPTAFSVVMALIVLAPNAGKLVHSVGSSQAAAAAAVSPQPSFSCARASTPTEAAICNNSQLAALDAQMGQLYGPLVIAHPELRADQRAWIHKRNKSCAGDAACLTQYLSDRVDNLKKLQSGS